MFKYGNNVGCNLEDTDFDTQQAEQSSLANCTVTHQVG